MVISTFINLTFEEQVGELLNYLKEQGVELDPAEELEKGPYSALRRVIESCEVCSREDTESDAEAVLASIVSLLFICSEQESEEEPSSVEAFCNKMKSEAAPNRLGSMCLRVLSLLFQGLAKENAFRCTVYSTLIYVANITGQVSSIFDSLDNLKKELFPSEPSIQEYQMLYRQLHQALAHSGDGGKAAAVMVELLRTYSSETASEAKEDAERCILTAIGDPSTYLFDHLLPLKPIRALQGTPLHELLTIFVGGNYHDFLAFHEKNPGLLEKLGLKKEPLLQKIRLLTFMQSTATDPEVSFERIEKELDLSPEQVEPFIFDVLRTGLVKARMDQHKKKVTVSASVQRTFGDEQWNQVAAILKLWKNNLSQVEASMGQVLAMKEEIAAQASAPRA
ncbi:unnamed protein product [Cyprideis torosa]|uniref:Eukaryotic translation initiation factor 3 subunit M n=1 Tax=Cyprideis torosa TaxID=163714 RepID=A0A7R8WJ22_9CRUS|nr:unnamed protein product [Cyprideis torosa]CAG0899536.1 unnamed protein product [Cyprideis torosa]